MKMIEPPLKILIFQDKGIDTLDQSPPTEEY